jgi:hypothetical protein
MILNFKKNSVLFNCTSTEPGYNHGGRLIQYSIALSGSSLALPSAIINPAAENTCSKELRLLGFQDTSTKCLKGNVVTVMCSPPIKGAVEFSGSSFVHLDTTCYLILVISL